MVQDDLVIPSNSDITAVNIFPYLLDINPHIASTPERNSTCTSVE
jgi:hypothetical protein